MRKRYYRVPRSSRNRPLTGGEAKFMGGTMLVVGVGIVGFFASINSLPSPTEESAKKTQAAAASAISALPSDCPRATPFKFPKPEPVIGAKKGDKFASPEQVANFDILGARLYTPVRDVIAAVQASGVFKGDPGVTLDSCASDRIEYDRLWREAPAGQIGPTEARRSCVSRLLFHGRDERNSVTLMVGFIEDLPQHPGCMVVNKIDLDQGGRVNSASIEAWDRALTSKYGQPHPYTHVWGE